MASDETGNNGLRVCTIYEAGIVLRLQMMASKGSETNPYTHTQPYISFIPITLPHTQPFRIHILPSTPHRGSFQINTSHTAHSVALPPNEAPPSAIAF